MRLRHNIALLAVAALMAATLSACSSETHGSSGIQIKPASADVPVGAGLSFEATVNGAAGRPVNWSVQEGATGGTIDAAGHYVAPTVEGTYHVSASDGTALSIRSAEVRVRNPNLALTISPSSATLATGRSLTLTATVSGGPGGVTWSVQEGTAGGMVTVSGVYTAPAVAGTYHVIATSTSRTTVQGIATITVTAASTPTPTPIVSVTVTPSTASVMELATAQFTASVSGSADVSVTWSVQEGASGGSVSSTGLYTAPATAATYHVVATSNADPTKTGNSAVTVAAPVAVSISPQSATVVTGGTVQFTGTVTGSTNTGLTWSVQEGTTGGSVSLTGLYTAPSTAGTYHVIATSAADPTKMATATVTVTAPVAVSITPQSASITTGGTVQFTAAVTGSSNTGVTWSVQEGAAGGTVSSTGLYTAPSTAGTYHVIANSAADPTKTASATVTVTAPVAVSITPQSASITTGGTVQFTATVTGSSNTGVTWSVQEGAAGGTVSSTGLYTAPSTAGTYHVVATSVADQSKSAVATITVTAPPPPGVVPAFPGAGGGGALSRGGRGGIVYQVTKLTDDGSVGTLRACVLASGPRTCVFTVSGVIDILGTMSITNPYLTVAGQTAPGAGIALRTQPGVTPGGTWVFDVSTHDVTIRYLKFWGDYIAGEPTGGSGGFGIAVHDPTYNLIVDHVDLLWYTGEGYDHWGTAIHNTSLQWSIVGENVNGTGAGQSTPVKLTASSYYPGDMHNVDLHHNLVTTGDLRNPLICTDSTRMVNNIVYNWTFFASAVDNGGSADFIGNYWKPGPNDKNSLHEVLMSRMGNGGTLYLTNNKSDWTGVHPAVTGLESDGGWSLLTCGTVLYEGATGVCDQAPLSASYNRSTPFCAQGQTSNCTPPPGTPGLPIQADQVANLQNIMTAPGGVGASARLDCYGHWVAQRDATETRIINDFVNGTGYIGQPTSATDANGGPLPTLGGGTPCTDTDGDGIPDSYEIAHGLNPSDPSDGQVVQSDGYTSLEHYLNGQ